MLTQTETDNLVARIRLLVVRHRAWSPILEKIRTWYSIFSRRPEAGSFIVLEKEVEAVENLCS